MKSGQFRSGGLVRLALPGLVAAEEQATGAAAEKGDAPAGKSGRAAEGDWGLEPGIVHH